MIAFRRPAPLAWMVLLVGLLLFVNLGRWQHGRAEFKREMIEQWAQAQAQAPRVEAGELRPDRGHFQSVMVTGRYQSQRYLLDNQMRDGRAGVEVFVALRSEYGAFLIALGWLPYSGATREAPPLPPLPDGPVQLHGIWTPVPAHGIRMGRDWPQLREYPKLMPYFALDEIAADAGLALADGVLRLAVDGDQPYRRDWRPVDAMPPERHLAYAWQWWSLAAAIVAVFLVVHYRRSPKP